MSDGQLGTSAPRVPIVDLFAGPGGLGEGFSALDGNLFRIAISIEMERTAHRTLQLRSFFRQFENGRAPREYYDYVRGDLPIADLRAARPCEWEQADAEAWQTELGAVKHEHVRARVDDALGAAHDTGNAVLIGGPPCQAYSLAGRSRMRRARGADFESDRRHFLYREYLKILADHAPSVFVLENVKGMLSSTNKGEQIFSRIQADLRRPGKALVDYEPRNRNVEYELFPLGSSPLRASNRCDPPAESYVLRSEDLGLPQARHRVIIVGVRSDLAEQARDALQPITKQAERATVADVLQGLPRLRSGLSQGSDSNYRWEIAVRSSAISLWENPRFLSRPIRDEVEQTRDKLRTPPGGRGGRFVQDEKAAPQYEPTWFADPRIGGVLNHESRGHMQDDLTRYLFAAAFGRTEGRSPSSTASMSPS